MIPKSTAPSEIKLAETPSASIKMNAPSSDSGMTAPTMTALRQSPRNTTRTRVTRMAPNARFSSTVRTV